MASALHPVSVTNLRSCGPHTWLLTWTRDFEFEPGQVVALALSERGPQRLYSLATGSRGTEAGVLFNVVEAGEITPSLATLLPGATLWVSQPFGTFIDRPGPAVWIANGTGVAPFLAMSEDADSAGKLLIHGARTVSAFYFQDQFVERLGSSYVRCCSTESGSGLYQGRLTSYLEERPWPADRPYYLCGSAPMIVEVRELLFRKGVPFRNILSEVFF